MVDLERIRAQIPAVQRCTYLNTGWSGPLPQAVTDAVQQVLALELRDGPTTPPVFARRAEIMEGAIRAVATLIHAEPEEISIRQNTTEGLNIVLNGLRWQEGDDIVTSNYEHGSLIVPLHYLRERRGVRPKFVQLDTQDSAKTVVAKFEQAMSRRTKLICISHICYSNGMRLPLRELADLAHAYNAWILVDAAQSPGQLVLDMKALQPDFYAMPGQKWLLGPSGTGALYIRRDLIEQVEPTYVAGSAAVHYDTAGHVEPRRDSIRKFQLSETNHALIAGLRAAVQFQIDLGPAHLAERIFNLGRYATKRLSEIAPKVRVVSPQGELSSGLVCFQIEGLEPPAIVAALWQVGRVVCRHVRETDCVRLSLHFFNTEQEIDQVADLISQFADHGLPEVTASGATAPPA